MELWFSDYHTEKVKVSVKVQKQLFGLQTEFQRILFFKRILNNFLVDNNVLHLFKLFLASLTRVLLIRFWFGNMELKF